MGVERNLTKCSSSSIGVLNTQTTKLRGRKLYLIALLILLGVSLIYYLQSTKPRYSTGHRFHSDRKVHQSRTVVTNNFDKDIHYGSQNADNIQETPDTKSHFHKLNDTETTIDISDSFDIDRNTKSHGTETTETTSTIKPGFYKNNFSETTLNISSSFDSDILIASQDAVKDTDTTVGTGIGFDTDRPNGSHNADNIQLTSKTTQKFYSVIATGTTVGTGIVVDTDRPIGSHNADNIQLTSKTNPKCYPVNGTGTTVDIGTDYDFAVFNSFCKVNWTIVAVLPVYSAPGNFKQRHAIRATVGKECIRLDCRVFFIVGISQNEKINDEVRSEHHTKKDILIINKVDTYRDLNNKAVAMLDWLIKYCPEPKYIIHIIDDTYPNLNYFLSRLLSMKGKRFILGYIYANKPVFRDKGNKWYVSQEEYPYPNYPDYLVGVAYAFLNSDSKILRDHVHSVEYCWVEDVWFTGIVAKGAKFTLVMLEKYFADYVPTITNETWQQYSCIHNVSPEHYFIIYNATTVNVNKL